MNPTDLLEEQIETSVELLFQQWRAYLFGADGWPVGCSPEPTKSDVKQFLRDAVRFSRYNQEHP